MVINLGYIQHQLGPDKQKLSDLTFGLEKCQQGDADLVANFVVNEFAERIKQDPVGLPLFAHQFAKDTFKGKFNKDLVGETDLDFIGLLPINLFEFADQVIRSNFTPVMITSSNFTYQLAEGISLVTGDGEEYPGPAEWLLPMSYVLGIIAEQVKPLSDSFVDIDSSVIGNVITTFPYVLQDSLSDSKQIEMTAEDCQTLMARFYATTWYTFYDHHTCEGASHPKQVGTGNIEVFHDIQIGCETLYTGIDAGN